MRTPVRIVYAARPHGPVALLAAVAAAALMFMATPFLIPEVSSRYGVSEGTAAAIAMAQVGAFAVVSFVLPRLRAPSGTILWRAATLLAGFNLLSALPETFWVLVVLRLLAGSAAGAMMWVAWTDAMQVKTSMAGVAAVAPLTALVGAPVIAFMSGYGDQAVYLLLAAATIPAVAMRCEVSGTRRVARSISRSRSNRVLLGVLFALAFFGSSLAVNLVIVARDIHGLSALATAVAFSLDALSGFVGARLSTRHRRPGVWLVSAGVAATVAVVGPTPMFFIGIALWGFSVWMAFPGILQMLSDRSLEPAERAADAQGLMALGRPFGVAMGGAFVDAGALIPLALVAGIGISAAGVTVIGVQEGRHRLPPTDPRTTKPEPSRNTFETKRLPG